MNRKKVLPVILYIIFLFAIFFVPAGAVAGVPLLLFFGEAFTRAYIRRGNITINTAIEEISKSFIQIVVGMGIVVSIVLIEPFANYALEANSYLKEILLSIIFIAFIVMYPFNVSVYRWAIHKYNLSTATKKAIRSARDNKYEAVMAYAMVLMSFFILWLGKLPEVTVPVALTVIIFVPAVYEQMITRKKRNQ